MGIDSELDATDKYIPDDGLATSECGVRPLHPLILLKYFVRKSKCSMSLLRYTELIKHDACSYISRDLARSDMTSYIMQSPDFSYLVVIRSATSYADFVSRIHRNK